MRRLTKVQILGASLLALALATGTGVVLSQSAPGPQSDKQPCTSHPCEDYVYEVQYYTADGKINGAVARKATGEGVPPPGSGILPQSGMATIVLTDPAQIRLLADLLATAKGQDYYVDLKTLTLNKREGSVPVPSATAESASWPFSGFGVLPPLTLAVGIGLSVVALVGVRRRRGVT